LRIEKFGGNGSVRPLSAYIIYIYWGIFNKIYICMREKLRQTFLHA